MKRAVKGFAVAAVAFLLCVSLADAANRDGSWEIGGFIPYVNDAPGFGVRGAYNITKNHEIEFTLMAIGTDASADDPSIGGKQEGDVDFTVWQIGYLYNWHPSDTVVPFVMGGIGSVNSELDEADVDEDDSLFYVGGGVRYFFNETFGLRFEGAVESVDADPDTLTNMYVGVGATFVLGG
jgi:hypothetical protein